MAPLLSITDDGWELFGNGNALLLFVAFVSNVIGDREVLVLRKKFWENAVVRMRGGAVYDGNGSIEGLPCVSRLVMMV